MVIVGAGEIGRALYNVLDGPYDVFLRDKEDLYVDSVDVLHICFPPSKEFNEYVKQYIEQYKPKVTIVHSSTPVGTCDELGVVHSPVRGVHPSLEDGIRTFVKYFGGKDARIAANFFGNIGVKTKCFKEARTTEAAKLWSTTQYGWNIVLEKEIHAWCVENGLDFDDVYTEFNQSYNKGYTELGMEHVIRPVLKHVEGEIGGHCIIPNARLLGGYVPGEILRRNKYYGGR